jgi:site-specific DNA-methyltransferase (adenine-specific)
VAHPRAKSPPRPGAAGHRAGDAAEAAGETAAPGSVTLHLADNLAFLAAEPDARYDLVYVDPPFNTGGLQARTRTRVVRDDAGDRVGFGGRRYRTEAIEALAFEDAFEDFLGFLRPRLEALHRVLKPTGSLFVHLDAREVHYVKVMLDGIFGRRAFINEIIWAYDYGARSRRRWSAKHDTILWYAKDPERYTYTYEAIDRIPYLAPGLVTPEKAARGKTPTDVWWHTIVSPTGREKTGYPTQKPLGILRRIVRVHSRPGDLLLDCFAGSGSFGEAGAALGRHVTLVDVNPEAHRVMRARLAPWLAPAPGP